MESARVNCRKPEEQIYRIMLERLGLQAEETVLLDDLRSNIETAKSLGMQGIKVR